jgi:hypothetical protein
MSHHPTAAAPPVTNHLPRPPPPDSPLPLPPLHLPNPARHKRKQVTLAFENRSSHAINNNRAVTEELAEELCFTDKHKVTASRVFDESSTQSRGVYACFPDKFTVRQMRELCQGGRYRRKFEDKLG